MNKGVRGNLSPQPWWPGKAARRNFWRSERQAQRAALPERLDDDYTYQEHMADICTPAAPCELCEKRRGA